MIDEHSMSDYNAKPFECGNESLAAFAERMKATEREELGRMQPHTAQVYVDSVLSPSRWQVVDQGQWAWSGDLADPAEDPDWMTQSDGMADEPRVVHPSLLIF